MWSETYDAEPDNVVLKMDEEILIVLLSHIRLAGKTVLDIGCGSGRHWARLLALSPFRVYGVDSSPEMLSRLRARHPDAKIHVRQATRLVPFADTSIDVIVSNLMLGYVRELEAELHEWTRVLRVGGEVILTDFHPAALISGGKRTFRHQGITFEIENHLHTVEALYGLFARLHWQVIERQERMFNGTPVVLGLRLWKSA